MKKCVSVEVAFSRCRFLFLLAQEHIWVLSSWRRIPVGMWHWQFIHVAQVWSQHTQCFVPSTCSMNYTLHCIWQSILIMRCFVFGSIIHSSTYAQLHRKNKCLIWKLVFSWLYVFTNISNISLYVVQGGKLAKYKHMHHHFIDMQSLWVKQKQKRSQSNYDFWRLA